MNQIKTAFRCLLATIILFLSGSDSQIQSYNGIDDKCIRCLCMEGCAISKDYWVDGGEQIRPGDEYVGTDLAYLNCLDSYQCSRNTIINYMKIFSRDCNNDGIISCYDYAAIHRRGPYACHLKHLPQNYYGQIRNCLNTWMFDTKTRPPRDMSPASAWFIMPSKLVVLIFILLLFGKTFI